MHSIEPIGDLHPTRLALITAGERLFAERGIHGVSLREIGAAAGQRNNNVTQYHFGSRDGLVVAIFLFRSAVVNEERNRYLDDAESSGRLDVQTTLGALLVPLANSIREAGNSYVRVLARLRLDGENAILRRDDLRAVSSAFHRIARLLRDGELSHLPVEQFRRRLALVVEMGVSALANYRDPDDALDDFVDDLVRCLSAFLLAPSTAPSAADR